MADDRTKILKEPAYLILNVSLDLDGQSSADKKPRAVIPDAIWAGDRMKRFDAGMTAGHAAADIDLGKYKTWPDADRIAINMARLYAEFSGQTTSDQDFGSFIKAREEYTALKVRR